jgi:hypothetical protein
MCNKWISVEERLPDLAHVLAFIADNGCGKSRTIRAQYAGEKELELNDESECAETEYDDETGKTFCPPGWYEDNEYDEVHWKVDAEVTHWMPLPDPPNIIV